MTEKLKSIILEEVVKTKKGIILGSRQYNHTININHQEIERETAEIIASQSKSIVINRYRRCFKPNSKVIEINLLTGEIFGKGKAR